MYRRSSLLPPFQISGSASSLRLDARARGGLAVGVAFGQIDDVFALTRRDGVKKEEIESDHERKLSKKQN